jgi:HPt (histidine-containing phosphotransfer) domain-containing protein
MLDAEFHKRIEPLRRTYVASLTDRAGTVARARAALVTGGLTPSALTALWHEMHRMRGVAPTFGFAPLGDYAGRAEDLLERQIKEGPPMAGGGALVAALDDVLDELARVVGV